MDGCEDLRLAESPDGFYVITYTQYSGRSYPLGPATSKGLKNWTKQGAPFVVTKYENKAFKSATVVHEMNNGRLVAAKISDKHCMHVNVRGGLLDASDDLIHWTPLENGIG